MRAGMALLCGRHLHRWVIMVVVGVPLQAVGDCRGRH